MSSKPQQEIITVNDNGRIRKFTRIPNIVGELTELIPDNLPSSARDEREDHAFTAGYDEGRRQAVREMQHGVTCPKAPHARDGYLHDESDDRPYDVDGQMYCGRCHIWLATPERGTK